MKSILLTTTAIVAFAGAAVADGHVTVTWSGAATAGMAREGGADAGTQSTLSETAQAAAIADTTGNSITTALLYQASVLDDVVSGTSITTTTAGTTATAIAADLAAVRAALTAAILTANTSGLSGAALKAVLTPLNEANALLDATFGSAEAATGDFDTYAEINATVVGSVALDNGMTLSGAMSVDAGTGYDFADDDGFDAAKTNGVAFDYVMLDAGAMGTLTFAPDDIAHLVDDDDDEAADVLYTNDFGVAAFSFALDVDKDTDATAADAVVAWDAAADETTYTPAVAADVQWSAKIAAPIGAAGSVYAAFDEEQGNAFGGSYTIEGITFSASSKLEALEAAQDEDRSNTIGASYTVAGLTVGGEYNTIKDGNQWSVSGSYAADAFSIAASTNEGEEWEVTGSIAISDNASFVGGVNYTEDAFAGVSFSF